MSKELEALEKLLEGYSKGMAGRSYYDIVYQALQRLEAIDNAHPSEALNYLTQFINEMTRCLENPKQYAKNYNKEIFYKYKHTLETTVKQALLKQLSGSQYTNIYIDEAVNPSEALECLERIGKYSVITDYEKDIVSTIKELLPNSFDIIKQSLIKAQEQEKVLEIIFEKRVDMWHLVDLLEQTYEMYLAFCKSEKYENDYILTQEEFDLLERWLND